jgi:hypothetical protein
MCQECQELGQKIQRYRKITQQGFDRLTIERITALIQELERQLQAMH